MKIVIDLPEEVTEWFKERAFIPIKYYTEVEEAMEKAETLSEVLTKIKAEIEADIERCTEAWHDPYENGRKEAKEEDLALLDKL